MGKKSQSPRRAEPSAHWIWVILVAAALLRIVYLLDYRAHSVFWDSMMLDAEVYDQWARRILAGDWLGEPEVYSLPPLYPYFVALLYKVLGASYAAIYIVQSLLGLVNIYFIYSIGRRVFGGYIPLVAATIATLYGSLMFMDAKLMSTTLALTLGLALMRLLLLAGDRQTLTLWGACGLLLGLTALVRAETLLFVPFAGAWIWHVTRRKLAARPASSIDQYALAGRQPWFALPVFAAFVIIAVSPVTLRNWVLTDDWSLSNLISSQAGITFYQSNNERGNGLYVFLAREGFSGNPHRQAAEEKSIAEKETGRPMKRSEVSRYWMRRGLEWIVGNPAKYFLLECQKLQRFLGSYEYSTEYAIYVERESVRSLWLAPLPFAVITSLALIGLLLQYRRGFSAPALLLALFVLSNFLVVMMFYVSSRYRMPSAPYLILFAAAGALRLGSGFRHPVSARRTEAWIYAVIALVLFVGFHVQVDDSAVVQEANVHYNAGNQYYQKEQFDQAIVEYDRAIAGSRRNWRYHYNKANTLLKLDRKQEAIGAYRTVIEINPEMRTARRQLRKLGVDP